MKAPRRDEIFATILELVRVHFGDRRTSHRSKLDARDAAGLEQPTLERGQALNPGLNELVEGARHLEADPLQGRLQLPTRGRARDQAPFHQVVEYRDHEERIPTRLLCNHLGELSQLGAGAVRTRDKLRDVRFAQRRENHLATEFLEQQPAAESVDGMRLFRGLLRPVGRDDEQLRPAAASCQRGKQIHSRIIRRVQVFQNEDQRSSCGNLLGPLAKLTHHARSRRTGDLLLQRCPGFP